VNKKCLVKVTGTVLRSGHFAVNWEMWMTRMERTTTMIIMI